jgi:hypothetical protein
MKPISFIALIACFPFIAYTQSGSDSAESNWSGSLAAYYYFIPGDKIPPTITGIADHGALHLESRYNYEDINSLSVFAGYNIEKNLGELSIAATPMAGMVVGNTKGILPGLEFTFSYKTFTLYSENEYMLDFKGKENYFFYSWTQLSAEAFKNVSAGVLAQSLRWYQTKFDVQRGLFGEYSTGRFTFDLYYFNPFTDYHFIIASANISF